MSSRVGNWRWIGIVGAFVMLAALLAVGVNSIGVTAQNATAVATQAAKATQARATANAEATKAGAAATKAATASATAAAAQTKAATAAAATQGHPAHIHQGTCANLNPTPQYPFPNVLPVSSSGNATVVAPAATATAAPVTAAIETTSAKVKVKLDDLLKTPHAIEVHESQANLQTAIDCGNIAGPIVNDQLVIGLHEQNNSGYSGIAILKRDGDNTDVTLYIAQGLAGPAVATPVA